MKEKISELLEIAKEEVKNYSDNEKIGALVLMGIGLESLIEEEKFEEAIEIFVKSIAIKQTT